MKRHARWLSLLYASLAIAALFAACGGGGGDDDDDDAAAANGDDAQASNDGSKAGDAKYEVKVPDNLADGGFSRGTAHLEVSGDRSFKGDFEGNGFVTNGAALFNFVNDSEGSVTIAFQKGTGNTPGAISITLKDVATGGELGSECSLNAEDAGGGLKGTFECKKTKGVAPTSAKDYTVSIKGNFTATR